MNPSRSRLARQHRTAIRLTPLTIRERKRRDAWCDRSNDASPNTLQIVPVEITRNNVGSQK